jgi:dihydrofolate synthase / folylpolyglutamate synthase
MTQLAKQLDYLANLRRFELIKPGLTTMKALLDALGNPHRQFRSLHLAGTNGKGSTATLLACALEQTAGPGKVGLYTSPYIHNFNERIKIDSRPVNDRQLAKLIAQTQAAADKHRLEPTYFEFVTALAFLHLAEQQVDTAVVEAGMGGRLDATNIITPTVAIITNISLDHTKWLGRTRRAIAENKAGIIKAGVPLVTAEPDEELLSYFRQVCAQHGAPLYPLAEYLTPAITSYSLDSQTFTIRGVINDTFTMPLLGEHQVVNACTALLALYAFSKAQARDLTPPAIARVKKGFARVRLPGRLEVISKHPLILVDGAHNEGGIRALARFLDNYPLPRPDTLVVGVKNDKDTNALVKHIAPRFRQVIVTEGNFQPMPAAKLAANMSRLERVRIMPPVRQALAAAQAGLAPDGMLLVTGSLYLAADALRILAKRQ